MDKLQIFKNLGSSQWLIEDELGTHNVHIKLAGNGWTWLEPASDGPVRLDHLVRIESHKRLFDVWFEADGTLTNIYRCRTNEVNAVTALDLDSGSPVTQFFWKTGKNSKGEEVTVPITHSLDTQVYGLWLQESDAVKS